MQYQERLIKRIPLITLMAAAAVSAAAQSNYAGEQGRSIKSLSEQDVAGLLAGRGH